MGRAWCKAGGDATDFATQKLGLDVVKGTIADLESDQRRFDAECGLPKGPR